MVRSRRHQSIAVVRRPIHSTVARPPSTRTVSPRDERGVVAREEGDDARDLARTPESFEGGELPKPLARRIVLGVRLGHRRLDESRRDGVGSDPVLPEFGGERAR